MIPAMQEVESDEMLKEALEETPTKNVVEWFKEKIKKTSSEFRRRFWRGKYSKKEAEEEQANDEKREEQVAAEQDVDGIISFSLPVN